MTPAEVRKQIASGTVAPIYLLVSDDPPSRHDVALEFAALVDEGLQAFNVHSLYANEATGAAGRDQLIVDLLAQARTLPMMAPRRVVIVYEAERLLSPKKSPEDDVPPPARSAGGAAKRKRGLTPSEELEAYFEAPEPLTTMVFVAGSLDENRRLVKLARTHAVAIDCGTLQDEAEAARWVRMRLEKEGLTIEPQAVSLLLNGTGLRLARIRAAVDRVALFAAGEKTVTPRHVRDVVQPHDEPGKDFPLGKAIWNGNTRAALREIAVQLDNGISSFMVLGQIRAAAIRLKPEHRIKKSLDAVLDADLAIKSSLGEPRFVLERLVVDLCEGR